jgi:hypothetical protein
MFRKTVLPLWFLHTGHYIPTNTGFLSSYVGKQCNSQGDQIELILAHYIGDCFVKITKVAKSFGYFFTWSRPYNNFDEKRAGPHFGRFFHNWSPC